MSTAGIGSQVLRFALAASLFDRLDEWKSTPDLARELGLNRHGLGEVLECLVSLGLLECGAEGYRNLDLATRFLTEESPQSLRAALLYQGAQTMSVSSVGRYVLNGPVDREGDAAESLRDAAHESLARFAAPHVLEKLDLGAHGGALLVGWGGDTWRQLAAERWPGLNWDVRNPFSGTGSSEPAQAISPNGHRYGAVVISGLLPCCGHQQFRPVLEAATRVLEPSGCLIVHEALIPDETMPAPETVLSAFGRHVTHGGARNWSCSRLEHELASLGFRVTAQHPIAGGTQLVVASRLS